MTGNRPDVGVELERFSVDYPGFRLGPLSMSLRPGDRAALLGANGAGKSTTLRAIAGRLLRYRGRILVDGEELRELLPAERARIGFVPERFGAFGWMTVREHLRFLAAFFPTWDRKYERELLRRLELPSEARVGALSRGQTAKLGIVCAEAYRPPVLLLDEPIAGLDPVMREELLDLLAACVPGTSGRILLFSSHLLDDVAHLADRILLLERGRLRTDAGRGELSARFPGLPLSRALHAIVAGKEVRCAGGGDG